MERMWNNQPKNSQPLTAIYPQRLTKSEPPSPAKLDGVKRVRPSRPGSFHAIHKVPLGDSPYDKAKQMQLMNKNPERAIALFWAAINAGDKVDSALKDMAIVMKQQNRAEEAIEAIISLRNRCSVHAQESLDNILLDLYKRCGRLEDQIKLLKHKLNLIHQGLAFNGKKTKTARSQGKKFRVTLEHEVTRLLGNLGWAYMQQSNYVAAEAVYRKALSIEPDNNKSCNLGICLMHQGRVAEAKLILRTVAPASSTGPRGADSHLRSYERAHEMLREAEAKEMNYDSHKENSFTEQSLQCSWRHTAPNQSEHEMLNSDLGDWEMTTFHATSGFALSQQEFLLISDKRFQSSLFDNASIEDKTEEDGFGDENININTISSVSASSQGMAFGVPQNPHTQHGKVEALRQRQRLEKVCFKENAGAKHSAFLPLNSSYTEQSSLNSAAAPFFSKYANQRDRQSTFSTDLGSTAGFEEMQSTLSNGLGSMAGFEEMQSTFSNDLGSMGGFEEMQSTFSNGLGSMAGFEERQSTFSNGLGSMRGFEEKQSTFSNGLGSMAAFEESQSTFSMGGFEEMQSTFSNGLGSMAGFEERQSTFSNGLGSMRGFEEKQSTFSNGLGSMAAFEESQSTFSNGFGSMAGFEERQSTFSNGLGSMAGFEERVPLMLDRKTEQRKNPFGPIDNACTRNTTKSENTNPVHQKKVLGSIGSGCTRNTVKSVNTNPVHQKKVLGPIGSGSTRNTVKSENINPVHQKKVLGPIGSGFTRNTTNSENTNPGDQRAFLCSGLESTGSGLHLPPLPMKNSKATKNSTTLPMQEKNAAADPCNSSGYIQLPDTLDFEQSLISEAANSDQASHSEKQKLQDRLRVFQEITLNARRNA